MKNKTLYLARLPAYILINAFWHWSSHTSVKEATPNIEAIVTPQALCQLVLLNTYPALDITDDWLNVIKKSCFKDLKQTNKKLNHFPFFSLFSCCYSITM
jgi:hypothetical protein